MASSIELEDIPVFFCKSNPISTPGNSYECFNPSSRILSKGFHKAEGFRPFPVDVIWERDVKIPMRDGVIIYADIFRPADTSVKVPAIISWSPYGKNGTGRRSRKLSHVNCAKLTYLQASFRSMYYLFELVCQSPGPQALKASKHPIPQNGSNTATQLSTLTHEVHLCRKVTPGITRQNVKLADG